jgi:DNA-binding IclR family transcriptional regulator
MARPALSARRSTEVLNLLAAHPDETFTLSNLARRLEINVSSLHAVLHALGDEGYVRRDPQSMTWSLGPVLVALGEAAARRHPLLELARHELAVLAGSLGVEGLLTAVAGDYLVILESVGRATDGRTTVGQRVPIVPPVAAVHMAVSAEDVQRGWLASAPARARPALRQLLADVAATGWAARVGTDPQPRLRRALAQRQDHPHGPDADDEIADVVRELADPASVVSSFEPRRRLEIAHLASPVVEPDGGVLGLYLVGFGAGITGRDATDAAERLVRAARSVTGSTGSARADSPVALGLL